MCNMANKEDGEKKMTKEYCDVCGVELSRPWGHSSGPRDEYTPRSEASIHIDDVKEGEKTRNYNFEKVCHGCASTVLAALENCRKR